MSGLLRYYSRTFDIYIKLSVTQALGYFQKGTSIGIIMLMYNCMTYNKCLHLL